VRGPDQGAVWRAGSRLAKVVGNLLLRSVLRRSPREGIGC
jgi:hypothetical protein